MAAASEVVVAAEIAGAEVDSAADSEVAAAAAVRVIVAASAADAVVVADSVSSRGKNDNLSKNTRIS